jgi:multicomponent Na+:H+ antiporter subunit B
MIPNMRDNPVFKIVSKILFGPIIIYGLYVQFHGDYGPGGGFQAGVIVAAAFILYAMIFGLEEGRKLMPDWVVRLVMALGVVVYGGTGVASMMLGANYLDYTPFAYKIYKAQHLGIIIVELGVGLTVFAVMVALFNAFAGFKPNK